MMKPTRPDKKRPDRKTLIAIAEGNRPAENIEEFRV